MIMADHRHRSKLYIWRSRRRWRPATPNTNPDPWLSNAPPGSTKLQRCWMGPRASPSMVRTALAPPAETATIADARWVAETADHILTVMEASRSTWQMWHVRAEAQRQVRTTAVTTERASALVDLLVDEVLDHRSVASRRAMTTSKNRRRCGGSTGPRSTPSPAPTSTPHSGSSTPKPVSSRQPDDATGQPSTRWRSTWPCWRWRRTALHSMLGRRHSSARCAPPGHVCSSRSPPPAPEKQLPCAPSPSPGPKTAARCSAWPRRPPQPPSWASKPASAADTLAKLTWSLRHGELPDWAAAVGPSTLVIIDEAGMADTFSLDTAVQFVIARGGSVRLIGDDQQLAAIGAGGVLRDIKHTHGALQLTELHRFTNPAEATSITPPP